MAEIINLRRARKTKARAQADAKADENRARFGRPKAERTLTAKIDDLAARRLEGHRLERDQPDGDRVQPHRFPDDET
ncbi:hypothetical protein GCM10007036_35770 [Alsobacter metallidurans]|uniref:DUF4169 family protein n=1 Tax=Alsobacter metallidurans TaxID=340221 RepID=A0A917ML27_9HYPH|nr:DUF4169 family protein [Alsobacter metallidurans]GGH27336.1 hypothetical protein GCM10007036_35770 [Alsobacter metallidurans]